MSSSPMAQRTTWLDRTLNRTLESLLIDPIAFRALVKAYFLMDFRNQQFGKSTATGPKALITPLFWVLGQNLMIGLFASGVMFARVDVQFFTLAGLTISMLVAAAAVIVEFNEIVIDPQDLAIIGHRPVPARTYAAARVINLMAYLLVSSSSVGLFPALVGAGLRDASVGQFPSYVAAALIGDFTAAGLVILCYVIVLRSVPKHELQDALAWLQVILVGATFYGGQVVLRDPRQQLQWFAYDLPKWTRWLPSMWLTRGVVGSGPADLSSWWILPAGACVLATVWWFVLKQLSMTYGSLQPGRSAWAPHSNSPLPAPGELGRAWVCRITHPGEERAAFWLTWTMLRRDPNLRMRSRLSLSLVIAALAVGTALGKLTNPITTPAADCVLTLAAVYLMAGAVPQLLHNFRYSAEYQSAWVLATAPLVDGARFVSGLRKVLLVQFTLPMVLLEFVVFAWIWRDLPSAIIHSALAGLVTWGMICGCSVIQLRRLPFAAPLARGESFGPIAPLSAATTSIAMLLAAVHSVVAHHWSWLAIYATSLVVGAFVIQVMSDLRLRRLLVRGISA